MTCNTCKAPLSLPAEGVNLADLERRFVIEALERTGGNRTEAGVLLGLTRDQVRYRITKLGLDIPAPTTRAAAGGD